MFAIILVVIVISLVIYIYNNHLNPAKVLGFYDVAKKYEKELIELRKEYISKAVDLNKNLEYKEAYKFFSSELKRLSSVNLLISRIQNIDINLVKNFIEHYNKFESYRKQWNHEYIQDELRTCSSMFDDIAGRSLDEQQKLAVVNGERNCLVVAGAGSGKTLTIAAKAKYLVERKKVNPKDILLVTFTRKASEEMVSRIKNELKIDADVKTFHSLGLDILNRKSDKILDVIDENDSERIFKNYFSEEVLKDTSSLNEIMQFYAYYLYQNPINEDDKNGSYIESLKGIDLETFKSKDARYVYLKNAEKEIRTFQNETVKSFDELMIANFLFLNGIRYTYECKYKGVLGTDYNTRAYKPDFYLDDYDIYIEHFGVDRQMNAKFLPNECERRKYSDSIIWKRETHQNNITKLIETYSYECQEGILFKKLEQRLSEHNVVLKPIDYEKFYKSVYLEGEDRHFEDLIKLIKGFLTLYKSNSNKVNRQPSTIRAKMFLQIFNKFFIYYEKELQASNCIDFNDMINKATESIQDLEFPYKYIIIDEYQDVSMGRFNLIKKLIDKTGASLMAVGDDWQSIYRFAGSDINLFSHFEKYTDACEILKLERTYRNSQELLDIAGRFVLQNESQISKKLVSEKHIGNPVRLIPYHDRDSKASALVNAIESIVNEFGTSKGIMLLGRTNYDIDFVRKNYNLFDIKYNRQSQRENVIYKKYPEMSIYFLTVHRSKGLEEDNIIIINTESGTYGFPNTIADDEVLQLVLAEAEEYPYAEERRLFYVAITRTKNTVFALLPDATPSVFIQEVEERHNLLRDLGAMGNNISASLNPNCPRCKTGRLIKKTVEATGKDFVGCSNYPLCEKTYNDLSILTKPQICSVCGDYLVWRKYKDRDFLGCSSYPYCNGPNR